jgi:hypothetical protein
MGQPGRQLSHRSKPVGLTKPGLDLPPLRQVLKDADETQQCAVRGRQWGQVDPDQDGMTIVTPDLKFL